MCVCCFCFLFRYTMSLINNNNLSGKQLCCYFCLPYTFRELSPLVRTSYTLIHWLIRVWHRHRHNLVVFIPLVCLFITHLIIIRCRVQLMITDQTVAINMKVRKRFSQFGSFFPFVRSFVRLFVRFVFLFCLLAVK